MALFPAEYPLWWKKQDNLDLVEAAHVNMIQDELDATQRALGRGVTVTTDQPQAWFPSNGSGPAAGNRFWSFVGSGNPVPWDSVDARLDNLEKAALRDLDRNYVSLFGGAVVTPDLNATRSPGGGIAVLLRAQDSEPAISIINEAGEDWKNGRITLWASGTITARRIELGVPEEPTPNRSIVPTLVLDYSAGVSIGQVVVNGSSVTVGSTVLRVDANQPGHTLVTLRPPVNPTGETVFLQNNAGGLRNVIHIKDAAGTTKFLVDTDGNTTVNTLKILSQPVDTSKLVCDGVLIDQSGLNFTWQGGAYRPGGLAFNSGGGLNGGQLTFNSGQRVYDTGSGVGTSGLLQSEGGILARGMTTRFYEASGIMYIPIPQVPGGPEGAYAPPNKAAAAGNLRSVHMPFEGPITGVVEVHLSVNVRAYSRPVYVSYQVFNVTTGAVVVDSADRHGCMNNGARSAGEQTDVDQVRTGSIAVFSGLTPGHQYEVRIHTRAADTGAGDVGKKWARADGCRVLIRPVMTSYAEAWVHG